jgi:hypothetical protein
MDESPAYLAPAVGVLAADDDDVSRQPQIAQGAMEANRLLCLVGNLRLNDEKVDIAVRTGLPAGMRPEQNHL